MVHEGFRSVVLGCALAAGVAASGCGHDEGAAGEGPIEVAAVFGEVGVNPGQFTYPRAIAHDGEQLWVIDKSARVQRIDPKTGASSALWTMPDWAMGKPCGVSIGPDGMMYIPDTHYFRVMVYPRVAELGKQPDMVGSFGSLGDGPGQFTYCTDVAFLADATGRKIERVYVGEYGGHDRISVFDGTYGFLFSFGSYGSSAEAEDVQFSRPQSIEVDGERGRIVVTDSCNHRIGVFDLEGKLLRWIGKAGSGPDELAYPYGVALLGDGTAMVTEYGNHRVRHVDYENGALLGTYGKAGRGKGELANPWAVTVMDGMVYVLDSGNDRIQVFRAPAARPRVSLAAGGTGGGGAGVAR